jgi:hypothetical protein
MKKKCGGLEEKLSKNNLVFLGQPIGLGHLFFKGQPIKFYGKKKVLTDIGKKKVVLR